MKPYQTITGWMDFEDYYAAIVAQATAGDIFVEVGTHKGRSLAFLAEQIIASGKQIEVIGVESDPDIFDVATENLRGVSFVRLWNCTSLKAAQRFADDSLAFVFIDADHSYAAVRADIAAWLPNVRPGGILAGHDYSRHDWPECYRAVNDALGTRVQPVSRSSWQMVKEAANG